MMKLLSPKTASLSLVVGALLAACNGGSGYVPAAVAPTSVGPVRDLVQTSTFPGMPPLGHIDASKLKCPAPYSKVPGTYVVMSTFGTLKNGTFVSAKAPFGGTWAQVAYTRATPGPTASPTTAPSSPPEYVYYGSYTLQKKKQTGCATLFTTQSGKDFTDIPANALSGGAPLVKALNFNLKVGVIGKLTEKITGVTATSGTGTAILTTSKGKPFDTATIKLVGRLAIK
jgi:hypothetical protein